MYTVLSEKKFQKQLRKLSSNKRFSPQALRAVVRLLASGESLPPQYKDHQLKGELSMYRECHIKDDLLLIYYKDKTVLVLVLVSIGTHHQLFGK